MAVNIQKTAASQPRNTSSTDSEMTSTDTTGNSSTAMGSGGTGGGMSALSALMRGNRGSVGGDATASSSLSSATDMPAGANPNASSNHHGVPSSFPNQPQNSPTFPSNLSPYAQPFVLPSTSTGGFSFSQTGIPMSLTGMGSLVNQHHLNMGMSISPPYGHHMSGGGVAGRSYTNGGMSFTHMGSYLGGNHNQQSMMMGGTSVGNDPQIGPGPAGSSVSSAIQHGPGRTWGVGGERSRELEKRYVRDFTCCGLNLGGLHDLLEQ